jgi:2'-5' RNA ligase
MLTKRIFIGNFIRSKQLDELFEQVRYYINPTGRFKWTRSIENLHITFHFFGAVETIKIPLIQDALSGILEEEFAIHIRITALQYFNRKHKPAVLYAKIEDQSGKLTALYSDIQQKLSDAGLIEKINPHFVPHITLARIKSVSDDFYNELKIFNDNWDEISIEKIKPQIIESILSPQGALYKAL